MINLFRLLWFDTGIEKVSSMIKIDHLTLYVSDLERAKHFWIHYFGATAGEMYHNPTTGLKTYFLSFKEGARLELMSRPDAEERGKSICQQGYIHLAISLGSKEEVDCVTEELRRDGYVVVSGPRVTGDGYYESCVLDAENNQIELTE